jgi:alkyl hydroperoxide reductase subunit AhpF
MFFDEDVAQALKERFSEMVHPVKLVVFSQALQYPESEEVKRLVEELGALDPRVIVESKNFVIDEALAKSLGIERIPAIAILRAGVDGAADHDYGVRFFGLPMQYDFGVLIDGILDVSKGESGLDPLTIEALNALPRSVHLQVFSTPT